MKINKKIKDERIVQLNNKIQSEAFVMVILLLSLSIFVKTYILDMSGRESMIELTILIISLAYIAIRSATVGYTSMDTFGIKSRILASLILAAVISIINGIQNYRLYGEKYTGITDFHFIAVLAITFLSSLIIIGVILGLVSFIEELGQKRLEKKLEDED